MPATSTPRTPDTPRTPSSPQPSERGRRTAGSGRDVLPALRLVALGHSPVEIAGLLRCPLVDVLRDLQAALALLGAGTVRDAIAEARRRGLLD